MREVWKYRVMPGKFMLSIPVGARFLDVQLQRGQPVLWADVESNAAVDDYWFQTVGTGHPAEIGNSRYIGTWQDGGLVWHLYEDKR